MHLSITSDVFVQVYLKQGARIVIADILSKIVLLFKQKRWRLWCLAETLHNCQLGSTAVQPTFTILSQKMSPQCHKSAHEYWIVLTSVQSPSNKPSLAIIQLKFHKSRVKWPTVAVKFFFCRLLSRAEGRRTPPRPTLTSQFSANCFNSLFDNSYNSVTILHPNDPFRLAIVLVDLFLDTWCSCSILDRSGS